MKKIEGKKLAEGEMTGHAHVLDNSEVYELDNGLRTFTGDKNNTLTHQENN